MTPAAAELGPLLRERRQDMRLGVRQLARMVRVDPGHLSKVERGTADASEDLLARLSHALDLPVGRVLPLAGKLPAGVEAELVSEQLVDGLLDRGQLRRSARRALRRRSLAALAERAMP